MDNRLLKIGVGFGVVVCMAIAVACGGGGGGGGGGSAVDTGDLGEGTTVAMGVSVTFPSASAKPGFSIMQADPAVGTVLLKDIHTGEIYVAAPVEDGFTPGVGGEPDSCEFTAEVPEGASLVVIAKRTLDEGLVTEKTEKVEAIVPDAQETGDTPQGVDVVTTKAAAIVKKKAANAGKTLAEITKDGITSVTQQANAIVGGSFFAGVDFAALTQTEIENLIVEYAVMLAVAMLAEQYALDWIDTYETVADADVATTVTNNQAAISTSIETDATAAGGTVDAATTVATVDETAAGTSGAVSDTYTQTVNAVQSLYIEAVEAMSAGNANLAYAKLASARDHADFATADASLQNKVKFLYALIRFPGMLLTEYAAGPAASPPADYTKKANLAQMQDYHFGVKKVTFKGFNSDYAEDERIDDGIGLDVTFEAGWTDGGTFHDSDDGWVDTNGNGVYDAGIDMYYDNDGDGVFEMQWGYLDAIDETMDQRAPSTAEMRQVLDGILVGELAAILADLESLPTTFYFTLSPAMQANQTTHTVEFDFVDVLALRMEIVFMKFMLDYLNGWNVDFTDPDTWTASPAWYPVTDLYKNIVSVNRLNDAANEQADPDAAEDQIWKDLFANNANFATADSAKMETARVSFKSFWQLAQSLVDWVQAFHTEKTARGLYPREIEVVDPVTGLVTDSYKEEYRTFHLVVNIDDFFKEFDDDIKDLLDAGDTAGAQAEIDSRWTDVTKFEGRLPEVVAACNGTSVIRMSAIDSEKVNETWNLSTLFGVQASGYQAFNPRKLMFSDSTGDLLDDDPEDVMQNTYKYFGLWPGVNYFVDSTYWVDQNAGIFEVRQMGHEFEICYETCPWDYLDGSITGSVISLTGETWCCETEETVALRLTATMSSATQMSGTRTEGTSSAAFSARRINDDMVTIQGEVYDYSTWKPIAGATVGTDLDGATATTNADGRFFLQTTADAEDYDWTPYTITITASGYQTFQNQWSWGSNAWNQYFQLTP